jgi:hypothetical protein
LQFKDHSDHGWQSFAAAQKQTNIFHHAAWSRLMEECYGYHPFVVVLPDAKGEICAGLPMMEINSLFTHRRWVSVPFSDHCSPLYRDSTAIDRLEKAIIFEAQKPGTPKIEIRWNLSRMNASPDFVLHTLHLESDVDRVCQGIHHSHLRNMRIARANGIRVVHGVGRKELSAFYNLHLQTRHRQGVPIQPWKYFELLDKLVLQRGLGFISLAWHEATCLAGAIFLHWRDTLTYKYGASTELGLSMRANHLLFWEAIRWGCDNGFGRLDFGRSDVDNIGLRSFKQRWGAVETPLRYSRFPDFARRASPQKIIPFMHFVIRNSPLWVCSTIGSLLYRYFG